mmetsp:Transcript_10512/g.34724  ORF Transcript_10512/g.34724 Transcript_10512/m.34724 type:complete len:188 (-) Transcript_10512:1537-2100(-)
MVPPNWVTGQQSEPRSGSIITSKLSVSNKKFEPATFETPFDYDKQPKKKARNYDPQYRDLLERLEGSDYTQHLTLLSRANHHLPSLLRRFFGSADTRREGGWRQARQSSHEAGARHRDNSRVDSALAERGCVRFPTCRSLALCCAVPRAAKDVRCLVFASTFLQSQALAGNGTRSRSPCHGAQSTHE